MANTEATRPTFWVQLASIQHSAISIQPLNTLSGTKEVRA
jgi:hypothetical protein